MPKTTLRTFLLGLLALIASYAYLTANTNLPQTVIVKEFPTINSEQEEIRTLNYLNTLRIGAGLIPLSHNPRLKEAANNHANYLITNDKIGHYEDKNLKGYTGEYGSDRSIHVGYQTPMIIENISSNNFNHKESIDGLMAAIYHRFGFLDFHIDEVGIAVGQNLQQKEKTAFVYNMGNKKLAKLCSTTTQTKKAQADDTLNNICSDHFKTVSKQNFYDAIHTHKYQNSSVVIYPFDGQKNIPPAFYEELPDPLPNHSVSGFPISISFNEARIQTLKMISFKLYDANGNNIHDTLMYDHKTDPNQQLKKFEFALFPLNRLEWNSTYHVKASYEMDGKLMSKSWNFRTQNFDIPLYTVQDYDTQYLVEEGKSVVFYFPPRSQRDTLGNLQYPANLDIRFIDKNTIELTTQKKFEGNLHLSLGQHQLNLITR